MILVGTITIKKRQLNMTSIFDKVLNDNQGLKSSRGDTEHSKPGSRADTAASAGLGPELSEKRHRESNNLVVTLIVILKSVLTAVYMLSVDSSSPGAPGTAAA